MLIHGGDLYLISQKYNIKEKDIIDFSGNINPFGLSPKIKDVVINNIDVVKTYPDKNYNLLKKSISNYCDCNPNNIIVSNGATELISLCIKTLSPKKAIIVSPSYSEYERELKKINCNIIYFDLKEKDDFLLNINNLLKIIDDTIDLIILCNPNNPTGTAITNDQIEIILKKCKFLMVDETYAEFSSKQENICATNLTTFYDNIFVIRGTSKFFCVPGIRLGYGICKNDYILNKINQNKDLWSVNCFANLIGQTMFNDKDFIQKTKNLVFNEKTRIFNELKNIQNLKFYNTKTNFILCKILNKKTTSTTVFKTLLKHNILIRDAKDFPFLDDSFFRFCILKQNENEMLLKNLKNILN